MFNPRRAGMGQPSRAGAAPGRNATAGVWMGIRTGLALAVIGAITAFVAHGLLQGAGIALIVVAAAGLWLRRRPGWTRHRAQAVGGWLTAGQDEVADGPRVPLEDMLQASPPGPPAGRETTPPGR
jgi:hypothetical protein